MAKIARELLGFWVTVSSELRAMAKIVSRSQSAMADAYLLPMTEEYLDELSRGFKGRLEDENARRVFVNQPDAELISISNFSGLRGVMTSPAGSIIKHATIGRIECPCWLLTVSHDIIGIWDSSYPDKRLLILTIFQWVVPARTSPGSP